MPSAKAKPATPIWDERSVIANFREAAQDPMLSDDIYFLPDTPEEDKDYAQIMLYGAGEIFHYQGLWSISHNCHALNQAVEKLGVLKVRFEERHERDESGQIIHGELRREPAPDAPYGIVVPESASRILIRETYTPHNFLIEHEGQFYKPVGKNQKERVDLMVEFLLQLASHPALELREGAWARFLPGNRRRWAPFG